MSLSTWVIGVLVIFLLASVEAIHRLSKELRNERAKNASRH